MYPEITLLFISPLFPCNNLQNSRHLSSPSVKNQRCTCCLKYNSLHISRICPPIELRLKSKPFILAVKTLDDSDPVVFAISVFLLPVGLQTIWSTKMFALSEIF